MNSCLRAMIDLQIVISMPLQKRRSPRFNRQPRLMQPQYGVVIGFLIPDVYIFFSGLVNDFRPGFWVVLFFSRSTLFVN